MTFVWTPDTTGFDAAWTVVDDEIKTRALIMATTSLQALTNNRVGSPPILIRPKLRCPCICGRNWSPWVDAYGVWRNACCNLGQQPSEIDIPGPVGWIDSMKIDGSDVDFTTGNWRLDDGHLLVWQGGGTSPIPFCQDLTKKPTEVGTVGIVYSRSYPVLPDARSAVGFLAMEFANAFLPKGKCALPRGVTSVVRNGVSFTIEAGLWPNGLTGIQVVDAFILKWAPPGSPTQAAQVFNPREWIARTRVSTGIPLRGSAGPTPGAGLFDSPVVVWPTGSEPSLVDVEDGTLWVEYTP